MKTFWNEPSKVLGKLIATVTYNDWTCKEVTLTVVEDGQKLIIGRDLFNSLGLAVVQQQSNSGNCVNKIDDCTRKIRGTVGSQIPHLVSRIGFSKSQVAKKFHQVSSKLYSKAPKGRRVPINLQPRVTVELDRLQKEGHMEKLSS